MGQTVLGKTRRNVEAKVSACPSGCCQDNSCYRWEVDQITSMALSDSVPKTKGEREMWISGDHAYLTDDEPLSPSEPSAIRGIITPALGELWWLSVWEYWANLQKMAISVQTKGHVMLFHIWEVTTFRAQSGKCSVSANLEIHVESGNKSLHTFQNNWFSAP